MARLVRRGTAPASRVYALSPQQGLIREAGHHSISTGEGETMSDAFRDDIARAVRSLTPKQRATVLEGLAQRGGLATLYDVKDELAQVGKFVDDTSPVVAR